MKNYSAVEVLKLVGKTTFKPFDKIDRSLFSGCKSKNPLIGYVKNLTILLDGATICLHDEEGREMIFDLPEGDQI